jgi:hypothetical protein
MNCICPTRVKTKFIEEQIHPERLEKAEQLLHDPGQVGEELRYNNPLLINNIMLST